MGKREDNLHKAIALYELGKSQKEISQIIGVSEQSLTAWKLDCEGTPLDWDTKKKQAEETHKSVASWLEEQIQDTMKAIEDDKGNEDLLVRLDKFISMKKKYDGSIDKLGEITRVMGAFANFVREQFPHDIELVKEITNSFMRYMSK